MLNEADEEWLRDHYPGLIREGNTVIGSIEFRASYSHEQNCFRILGDASAPETAVTLSGAFQIRIEERVDASTSQLPALHVLDIEHSPDRHFNRKDNSACLCSPLEERDFTEPTFQFQSFLERLVVPFLYGQLYYSVEERWPWTEYAHGATGILEAYSRISDRELAAECLRQLVQDANWVKIRNALTQKPFVKGHTPCFCSRMDHIRRCHPRALTGALLLQKDLKARGIRIP